jgi:hypothetical protein
MFTYNVVPYGTLPKNLVGLARLMHSRKVAEYEYRCLQGERKIRVADQKFSLE